MGSSPFKAKMSGFLHKMGKTYGENGLQTPFLSISPLIGRFMLFWLFDLVFLYFGHLAVVVLNFFIK